ncbi:BCD family MFS transporter [Rivibacter subsaxonicus]|uniref:BCD family chlorophyll transporter-like MFS transporter n=1 Tax=Rivibacter subsaxonicus TaxID=457575 RepID=A0A4Q7W106_9BURK|nr:BCD family MFS transporter [Rivibacter subsaxonicus]RZU02881.1 BCD family chlorophyll transporter-like MFS transporter [Rivibacter subsaxonicus]
MNPPAEGFGWLQIVRLGLVQASLGAVVVLTTSTLNRVMVVELALPALLPGLLVALHYAVQVVRPRLGHGADVGGRSTPWIVGGMLALALGGVGAALATAWMGSNRIGGIAAAVVAFALIGIGVGAAGTSLLVLMAKRVDASRRAAAATIVWMMMIVGFIVTAASAGALLDPYSPARLVAVTAGVALAAFVLTLVAMHRLEGAAGSLATAVTAGAPKPAFRVALAEVWAERAARQFTIFVFIAMLAYSAQDLILEPFAGSVFGFTPGASTQLSAVQHSGVLLGMVVVALAGSGWLGQQLRSLRVWTIGGCIASALALLGLTLGGLVGPGWPLKPNVFLLGAANGAFSIAAIASMMRLAGEGRGAREGVRMGLWGAAQATAFGLGGVLGTAASDVAHWLIVHPGTAYAAVFGLEALLFLASARLAAGIGCGPSTAASRAAQPARGLSYGAALEPRRSP